MSPEPVSPTFFLPMDIGDEPLSLQPNEVPPVLSDGGLENAYAITGYTPTVPRLNPSNVGIESALSIPVDHSSSICAQHSSPHEGTLIDGHTPELEGSSGRRNLSQEERNIVRRQKYLDHPNAADIRAERRERRRDDPRADEIRAERREGRRDDPRADEIRAERREGRRDDPRADETRAERQEGRRDDPRADDLHADLQPNMVAPPVIPDAGLQNAYSITGFTPSTKKSKRH
jgi:hypothetical protein